MSLEPLNLLPPFLKRKLEGRPNLVKVINNSGWLVLDKMVRGVLTLVVGAWVARYLGPEQFGQLAYVLAYLAFFQVVANLGMDGIIVRDIAQIQHTSESPPASPNNSNIKLTPSSPAAKIGTILGTAFTMRLITGVFCWLLAIIGMGITEGWHSQLFWLTVLAGGMLVFQAADTIDLWFQSQSQSKRTVWAKLIAYMISNGLKIALILGKFPLVYFAGVVFVELAISATALVYVYQCFPCGAAWRKNIAEQGKTLIRQSWPYILTGISVVLYMRIDQVFIKNMLGEKELGIYAAMVAIAVMGYFIPGVLCISLMPSVAVRKHQSQSAYLQALRKVYALMLIVAIGLTSFLVVFSSPIVSLLYGNRYANGSNVLSIYALANIPVFMGVTHGLWIVNDNKNIISFYRTFAGGITAFLLCWLLIPIYGITGAAISVLIAFTVSDIVMPFVLNPTLFIALIKK